MNSSSLPGTAASPLELPLGGKRHFHEAENLYYRTKEGGERKNCAMKNEMHNSWIIVLAYHQSNSPA